MTAVEGDLAAPGRILRYGRSDDQWVEVSYPTGNVRGIAVLIHGGYWRTPFTAELMRPLVPSFLARGWVVANVEYRRGDDGWAAMGEDLSGAMSSARSLAPTARVAIIGHSVGGQLALLAGHTGDAVIALAPVSDVTRGYQEGIGDGAVAEFFRDSPAVRPDLYAAASPLAHLPPPAEVLVVHGRDDARVPFAHTRDYVEAARAAGGDVDLIELTRLSHMDAIAPGAPHWPAVHAWLDERQPPPIP
ncbi:alpha/beta hydrolase family protein [Microbacterium sp. P01]|uniref:alpha/beta hydrolase family protein n=1 Tax=unclassified Microbacterium TaxID=2609290 RepID=UPI00366DA96F